MTTEFTEDRLKRLADVESFKEKCRGLGILAEIIAIDTPSALLNEVEPGLFETVTLSDTTKLNPTKLVVANVRSLHLDGYKEEEERPTVLRLLQPGSEGDFFSQWYAKFKEVIGSAKQVFVYRAPMLGTGELYAVDSLRVWQLKNDETTNLSLADIETMQIVDVMGRFWVADQLDTETAAVLALTNALGGE